MANSNIHAPQRFDGESQRDYLLRRAAAQSAVDRVIGKGLSGGINSRKQHRDAMRKSGTMGKKTRAYVALMAYFASKRVLKPGINKGGNGLVCVKPLKGHALTMPKAISHRQIKRARMAPLRASRLAASSN